MFKKLSVIILILAVATMACSINFNLPVSEVTTGELQTDEISVPVPATTPVDVTLSFGAGNLRVSAGAEGALISGEANYNVKQFKPEVTITGSQVKIDTGDLEISGFPRITNDIRNDWNLKLGDIPMRLVINAGAYKGEYELGGLSLTNLKVTDGAAEVKMNFASLNLVVMDELRYETGASSVRLNGLANANFRKMNFKSGAGSYTLDFSGTLQQDASVKIESGISQITIIVPKGVAAQLTFNGGISNINAQGDWQKSGNQYENPGSGSQLVIQIEMGAGNIVLVNTP